MKELFEWLNNSKENLLNRSCIFHYEVVNIHPFPDGNGKMGRLWQTLILMQEIKAFELIPLEYYIQGSLEKYYDALYSSDKTTGEKSFVEYMFSLIEKALRDYHDSDFLLK
jgi:Fic family protein